MYQFNSSHIWVKETRELASAFVSTVSPVGVVWRALGIDYRGGALPGELDATQPQQTKRRNATQRNRTGRGRAPTTTHPPSSRPQPLTSFILPAFPFPMVA